MSSTVKQRRKGGAKAKKGRDESPVEKDAPSRSIGAASSLKRRMVLALAAVTCVIVAYACYSVLTGASPSLEDLFKRMQASITGETTATKSEAPKAEANAAVLKDAKRERAMGRTTKGKVKRAIPLDDDPNVAKQNQFVEEEEIKEIETIANCSSHFASPAAGRKQKCCALKPGKLTCLPNLVLMGAQKSGSTAVHSYFLVHPQMSPGRKKELHLFDFDKNFRVIRQRVEFLLPPLDPQVVSQRITVDSTPSYIADHKACPRMASILSPDARFIVVLREPTERMWSELQMKQRRVFLQDEFLYDILPKYHAQLSNCFATCEQPCNAAKLVACLPEPLRKHGRMSAFTKFLEDPHKEGLRFMQECLVSEQAATTCLKGRFYDKVMKEKMPPVPGEVYNEIKMLKRVLVNCCTGDAKLVPERSRTGLPVNEFDTPERGIHAIADDYGFCKGCGCHCFPRASMISDIAKAHVWRSLYYPHLLHCFASIDPSRVLVLDMKELERDPKTVMSRIFRYAGLKDVDVSTYTPEQIQAIFRRYYPDFETISGWGHLKANPDELPKRMPDEMKAAVNEFLRPYNRLLFQLLGTPPLEGWAV
jgi:hypothetical protein